MPFACWKPDIVEQLEKFLLAIPSLVLCLLLKITNICIIRCSFNLQISIHKSRICPVTRLVSPLGYVTFSNQLVIYNFVAGTAWQGDCSWRIVIWGTFNSFLSIWQSLAVWHWHCMTLYRPGRYWDRRWPWQRSFMISRLRSGCFLSWPVFHSLTL